MPAEPRLFGLLVTYRRPEALAIHLDVLATQTRRLDHLVVVDNGPLPETPGLVEAHPRAAHEVEHLEMPSNLGPAGAIGRGLRHLVDRAGPEDWVVLLDDDDPPDRDDLLESLWSFATDQAGRHPRLGMVGLTGARFDFRRGRIVRLRDHELHGAVPVDYVAGGQLPMIRFAAVRDVGGFREDLFFGFDDLEYGLRLRARGYDLLIAGDLALWARANAGRLGDRVGAPQLAETALLPWRRYYSVRNLVVILREHGRLWPALRTSLTAGLAKGTVLLLRRRRAGVPHLRVSLQAVVDGWSGRLGRRLQPPA